MARTRYSIVFKTDQPLTQEQGQKFWIAGDRFQALSTVYHFEGTVATDNWHSAIAEGVWHISHIVLPEPEPPYTNRYTILEVNARMESESTEVIGGSDTTQTETGQ